MSAAPISADGLSSTASVVTQLRAHGGRPNTQRATQSSGSDHLRAGPRPAYRSTAPDTRDSKMSADCGRATRPIYKSQRFMTDDGVRHQIRREQKPDRHRRREKHAESALRRVFFSPTRGADASASASPISSINRRRPLLSNRTSSRHRCYTRVHNEIINDVVDVRLSNWDRSLPLQRPRTKRRLSQAVQQAGTS